MTINCESCGKFISYSDIDTGNAFVTDDGDCAFGCPCLDIKYSHTKCVGENDK